MKLVDIPVNTNDLYKWVGAPHWSQRGAGLIPVVTFHWGIFTGVIPYEILGDCFGVSWGVSLNPSTIGEELGFQP
jgi:hypothetical protein